MSAHLGNGKPRTDKEGRIYHKVLLSFEQGGSYLGYVWAYGFQSAYQLALQDARMASPNPQRLEGITDFTIKRIEEDSDEDLLSRANDRTRG